MAKYQCSVCGFIYDEEAEGKPFAELTECPVCKQPASVFEKIEDPAREKASDYRYLREIQEMAKTGKSIIEAMGTKMPMPNWDDILILGAQLNPPPLDEHAEVNIRTVNSTEPINTTNVEAGINDMSEMSDFLSENPIPKKQKRKES